MKILLKLLLVAVVLAAVFFATFALWGDFFEALFNQQRCSEWFAQIRPWAWLVAIGLLVADLLLPIPATGIMAALGSLYGLPFGAAIGAAGSTLAAVTGYALARLAGRGGTRWIADDREMHRFSGLFDRWGGAVIILSRLLPILPEVVSVCAGLARMRFTRFLVAVLLGTIPTAILFAWLGAASAAEPWWGMGIATAIPLVLWPVFLLATRPKRRGASDDA